MTFFLNLVSAMIATLGTCVAILLMAGVIIWLLIKCLKSDLPIVKVALVSLLIITILVFVAKVT